MPDKAFIDTLTALGLSENEAKIYLAILASGPSTIVKVARASGIKRTTVYSVMDALKNKGLISVEIKGLKQLFAAENPGKLEALAEERKKKLERSLPELAALYNLKGGESSIKYYEGLSGLKTVYENLLAIIQPHDYYLVVGDQEAWLNLDEKYFKKFIERRAKYNIDIRLILQNTESAREFQKFQRNYNEQIKLLAPQVKLKSELVITPRRFITHQLDSPLITIVIENQNVIQLQKEIFEVIWQSL